MTTQRYEYDEQTQREVERMVRDALPSGVRLQRVSLERDFGGVDAVYRVNHRCDLQTRCRFNRPHGAWTIDITFRETEPRMVTAGTYAPLAIFIWFRDGWAQVGRLIDIYRMAERIDPPLDRRDVERHGRNGNFIPVTIPELVAANAILRGGDRDSWSTWADDGNKRLARLLAADQKPQPAPQLDPDPADDFDIEAGVFVSRFLAELEADDHL